MEQDRRFGGNEGGLGSDISKGSYCKIATKTNSSGNKIGPVELDLIGASVLGGLAFISSSKPVKLVAAIGAAYLIADGIRCLCDELGEEIKESEIAWTEY